MQKTLTKKVLLAIVCAVLIAAVALFTHGCSNNEPTPPSTTAPVQDATPIGEGTTKFTFTVTAPDGTEASFLVSTDKTEVGEALQELGLISGDEGPYGLYVKTVNGITVDYDTDGMYWAFYINGQMSPTGVDVTDITPDAVYSFKAEK
ncbi:MAG: DUF4430 domain-containing protein [Clostridia bacterium]|nr:DUF4430 domain-containing protein [Clostridia bacterium]